MERAVILAAETDLFPVSLMDEPCVCDNERRWWAIYTKARQEKALARELTCYGVPFYLPLIPKDNLIRGRRVRSYLPLFSGYLFLYSNEEERVRSLTTNRISRVLPVNDQDLLFCDLQNIRRLISCDVPLTIESKLETGQRVRIKSGLLRDMEGTIIKRRGQSRLLVTVDFLLQGASVEIGDFQVEAI